jgi:hypothetical protein
MSTMEQDIKKQVNVKKVVKAVKNIGEFALYSKSEDCNLLVTRNFILNLTEEQFWEVQCALLAKQIGVWFTICKEGLVEGKSIEEDNFGVNLYFKTVHDPIAEIIGFTELILNGVMLYAGEEKYIGIKESYIEMIGGLSAIKKARNSSVVIASDYHVLTIVDKIESEYLAPLLF